MESCLTQFHDKKPYTNREFIKCKATAQNTTQNFEYKAIETRP